MAELIVLRGNGPSRCERCPLATEIKGLEAEVREARRALGAIQRWARAELDRLQLSEP